MRDLGVCEACSERRRVGGKKIVINHKGIFCLVWSGLVVRSTAQGLSCLDDDDVETQAKLAGWLAGRGLHSLL